MNTIKAFGEEKNIIEWTKDPRCQITSKTLRMRIQNGWDYEDAIIKPVYAGRSKKRKEALDDPGGCYLCSTCWNCYRSLDACPHIKEEIMTCQ